MKITLKHLKELNACYDGILWVKTQKNRETKHILRKCLKKGHFFWANWYVTKLFNHRQCVQYSVFASEFCLKEFERAYPEDLRPREAIEAAKNWLLNPTEENRVAAWSSAWSAMSAAESAARSAAMSAAESAAESAESAESALIEKAIELLGL